MEPVLPRRLQVDVRLLHVLCLVLLHQLIPLALCGHHLVAVVTNKFLWSLQEKKQGKQHTVTRKQHKPETKMNKVLQTSV